ncbi:MAG: FecR domain-containing protein [Planctomycetota bacterium]|jgi:hypothetical protein
MRDETTNNHDMEAAVGGDRYLWDRTGPVDPDVQRMERVLSPLRHRGNGHSRPSDHDRLRRRALRWALAAGLLLAASATWLFLRPRPAAPAAWEVQAIAGRATIDSALLGAAGRLGVGQWLETADESQARVKVADIGSVTVHSNSRLRLLATQADQEHRLELALGKIEAIITAPPRLFFVDTPSAVAVDLGCAYLLEVHDDGRGRLEVTSGLVSFERNGRVSIVPVGGICRTRPTIGPGTPYFCDASETLKRGLEDFDFNNGPDAALETVLTEARRRDTLTLWHLLPRVGDHRIGRVFDRLAALTAPPAGVTREGILRLDQVMLRQWWVELELSWLDTG